MYFAYRDVFTRELKVLESYMVEWSSKYFLLNSTNTDLTLFVLFFVGYIMIEEVYYISGETIR